MSTNHSGFSTPAPRFRFGALFGVGAVLLALLFYAVHVVEVVSQARSASSQSSQQGTIVVLGKRLAGGELDADFLARLARVQALLKSHPQRGLVLSGGGSPGPTEAQQALVMLKKDLGLNVITPSTWDLENASRDTRENLINTRALLSDPTHTVSVVSSRYHLARVNRLARTTGLNVELVGAEEALPLDANSLVNLLREAAYLSWLDLEL